MEYILIWRSVSVKACSGSNYERWPVSVQAHYKQMSRSLILLRLYKASPLLQIDTNLRLSDAPNWIQ